MVHCIYIGSRWPRPHLMIMILPPTFTFTVIKAGRSPGVLFKERRNLKVPCPIYSVQRSIAVGWYCLEITCMAMTSRWIEIVGARIWNNNRGLKIEIVKWMSWMSQRPSISQICLHASVLMASHHHNTTMSESFLMKKVALPWSLAF